MNIVISVLVLSILFILYKYTYFFKIKRHRIFQYGLIIFLFTLALIDVAIGNRILKDLGFTIIVGLNFFLALLLLFAGGKAIK